MYTAPKRRAGVGASFRVHKLCPVPGPRPDLRSGTLVKEDMGTLVLAYRSEVR